jgi:hypothetical protein
MVLEALGVLFLGGEASSIHTICCSPLSSSGRSASEALL